MARKRNILFSLLFFCLGTLYAQQGGGGGRGNGQGRVNTGHFYGKVVDSLSGKGIEFASVQLFQEKWDSATAAKKLSIAGGMLTEANGDFSIENLPLNGIYVLRISFLAYVTKEMKIGFDGMRNPDKDLGNIRLRPNTKLLKTVEVDGSEPALRLEIDRKVYDMDKNPVNAGGTAEDALKNVPSVNVDMDGNVSIRNAEPQILVDGQPTTLSLDQIPADAIQNIELITNPSAKYDASGGSAGIINIVLKKNRKIGYNGTVKGGVDARGKVNFSGDVNARENKINVFSSVHFRQNRSLGTNYTERVNFYEKPTTMITQNAKSESNSLHGSVKGGIDYFIDNRNTITLSGSFNKGKFSPGDNIDARFDTLNGNGSSVSLSTRSSLTERRWKNIGSTLAYKHLFPQQGKELTADASYNRNFSENEGSFTTQNYDINNAPSGEASRQKIAGSGGNYYITAQTDMKHPFTDKMKLEYGIRGSVKNSSTRNKNYYFSSTAGDFVEIPSLTGNYDFIDQVYAGYGIFTKSIGKVGFQTGLRVESSHYLSTLPDSSYSFSTDYPLSLFPSTFINYKINDNNDIQLNYTRRINRPGFFQIFPFTDYSDSLNINRGNPYLKPEFTHSSELSYQRVFNKTNSFLFSTYFKMSTNIITRFQQLEKNTVTGEDVIVNTYANANASYSYGMEFTSQNSIGKFLNLTLNFNLYNSIIDAKNLENGLTREQLSWFTKLNLNFKLPRNLTYQVMGNYQSRTALPLSGGSERSGGSGGGGGGGGGNWFGQPSSTIQGYNEANYSVDMALKLEFLKEKRASLTFNVSDVFKTKVQESYSASPLFSQSSVRKKDQQLFKISFSYSFGKFDVSLFKRKNTASGGEGEM